MTPTTRTLLALTAACTTDTPCVDPQLTCDGPCPTLAELDPRLGGNAAGACHVSTCRDDDGTDHTIVRTTLVQEDGPTHWWFDDAGVLQAIEGTGGTDGDTLCASQWSGPTQTCAPLVDVYDDCGDGAGE